jgi:hypothetical protein
MTSATLALDSWKGFQPFATLSVPSSVLERRAGLSFRASHDDLDETRESAFTSPSGIVIGVVEHVNSPVGGVELLAHVSEFAKGISTLVRESVAALGLRVEEVNWTLAPPSLALKRPMLFFAGLGESADSAEVVEVVHNVARHAGYDVFAPWTDLLEDSRLVSHIEVLRHSSLVLFYASTRSQRSFYELGLARALGKPVVLLGSSGESRLAPGAPRFDRELLLSDIRDSREVQRVVTELLASTSYRVIAHDFRVGLERNAFKSSRHEGDPERVVSTFAHRALSSALRINELLVRWLLVRLHR